MIKSSANREGFKLKIVEALYENLYLMSLLGCCSNTTLTFKVSWHCVKGRLESKFLKIIQWSYSLRKDRQQNMSEDWMKRLHRNSKQLYRCSRTVSLQEVISFFAAVLLCWILETKHYIVYPSLTDSLIHSHTFFFFVRSGWLAFSTAILLWWNRWGRTQIYLNVILCIQTISTT